MYVNPDTPIPGFTIKIDPDLHTGFQLTWCIFSIPKNYCYPETPVPNILQNEST